MFGYNTLHISTNEHDSVSGRKFCLALPELPTMKRGKEQGGKKESWHKVVKLEHGNPNKPLSKCDQKLPIIFIVQEILSLQLVETNGPWHISDAFSFYKARSTDKHFCHQLRLDVFIKPLVTEIFFPK